MKSVFKGRRCSNTTDIFKNAAEELKRLSQNCFQSLTDMFVCTTDHIEENVA
jgi:hypothetical protein